MTCTSATCSHLERCLVVVLHGGLHDLVHKVFKEITHFCGRQWGANNLANEERWRAVSPPPLVSLLFSFYVILHSQ